jgi:hypothetical protein
MASSQFTGDQVNQWMQWYHMQLMVNASYAMPTLSFFPTPLISPIPFHSPLTNSLVANVAAPVAVLSEEKPSLLNLPSIEQAPRLMGENVIVQAGPREEEKETKSVVTAKPRRSLDEEGLSLSSTRHAKEKKQRPQKKANLQVKQRKQAAARAYNEHVLTVRSLKENISDMKIFHVFSDNPPRPLISVKDLFIEHGVAAHGRAVAGALNTCINQLELSPMKAKIMHEQGQHETGLYLCQEVIDRICQIRRSKEKWRGVANDLQHALDEYNKWYKLQEEKRLSNNSSSSSLARTPSPSSTSSTSRMSALLSVATLKDPLAPNQKRESLTDAQQSSAVTANNKRPSNLVSLSLLNSVNNDDDEVVSSNQKRARLKK